MVGRIQSVFPGSILPVSGLMSFYSYYEGHSMEDVTFPVRVLKLLGVETIICG